MKNAQAKTRADFRVSIGRADKGRTFVRVVHSPSKRERIAVGLGDRDAHEVADQLIRELQTELTETRRRAS